MMTTRDIFTSARISACATFALAGVLASDIFRLLLRYDAGELVEGAAVACAVVGFLATFLWMLALQKSGGPPLSMPKHKTINWLFPVVWVASFFVPPSIRSFHQFVMHCTPLVTSYLIWSMWKANDTPQA
jgi:hypothetical protein